MFQEMDSDNSGDISVKELRRHLDKLGLSILHQDSEALISSMDKDKNGKVDKNEFMQFLSADHKEAIELAQTKALEDLKFRQGSAPVAGGVEKPFMRPTIISTQKLVKQVFRRQSLSDNTGPLNKMHLGVKRMPAGGAINPSGTSISATATPPNFGKGQDGIIYNGLDAGPNSRLEQRRNSARLGRMLLPSLTAPPALESRAPTVTSPFNPNARPLSPPVTTKAQTFPLGAGSSRTAGFEKAQPTRPASGFGPFSASWPVKRNVTHNFTIADDSPSIYKSMYRPNPSRPKSKALQRRAFPGAKWLRGRKALSSKPSQAVKTADLSVLERFASVAKHAELHGAQHIPTRSFGKERSQQN